MLRQQLRGNERSLIDKFSARIAQVEKLKPWFGIAAIVGTLLVAVARFLPAGGMFLTIGAAAVTALAGIVVVLLDFKKLEIAQEAKGAHEIADEAISALEASQLEASAAQRRCDDAARMDVKRLARIDATRLMIESISAAGLTNADQAASAGRLLERAVSTLRNAVDYEAGDFLTFTIFQVQGARTSPRMVPIARQWTDLNAAQSLGRSWRVGEGYTGRLWEHAKNDPAAHVIESDTASSDALGRYRVPGASPDREARYRSVASFPILVGENNKVWGAVTATSNRPGVFDHSGQMAKQNVETVRDVALAASLLANLRAG